VGHLLLVAPTTAELAVLRGIDELRPVTCGQLSMLLGQADATVDAVLVGGDVQAPLPVVQQVHAADAATAVAVLTGPDSDAEVRRTMSYAPGVPAGLLVIERADDELREKVAELFEAARARRQHEALLAAVAGQASEQTAHVPLPRSLGTLLHHAPFGMMVADLEGRLVGWNPWAGDLLGVGPEATGRPVTELFTPPEPLLGFLELARHGRLTETAPTIVLQAPQGISVEVNAVPTELESGRAAVLLLVQDVTERRRAEATRDRLAAHVGLLARVSEALAGTLDGEAALRRLAEQLVPVLADWVSLQVYDARGNPCRVAVHHKDPARRRLVESVQRSVAELDGDTPSRLVARGHGPQLVNDLSPATLAEMVPDPATRAVLEELGVGSVLAVPLPARGGVLGSMVLVNGPSGPAFTEQDLAVATEVGRRAGITLETIGLYAQQSDLAAALQRSLLTDPPESDQGEIEVRYLAAAEEAQVGGDWYDAFLQADGGTVVVIGDVIGHDTRAAAAMGQIRALLRGIGYTTGAGPAGMLSRLDAAMDGLDVRTTATAVVARIDQHPEIPGVRRLRWSNAGHPPPILVVPGEPARALEAQESDLLLGVIVDTLRREHELSVPAGSTLLLYTDGLVERRGRGIDEGVAEMVAAVDRLAHLPVEQLCDRLLERLLPVELDDDVALVAVRLA
jgi:PAS domain S-box-containing protein